MVDLHAQRLEVGLDLGNQVEDPRVIRRHEVDLQAGDAGVAQELGRGRLVVGQVGCGLLVGGVRLGQEGGGLDGLAVKRGADQLLLVDGLQECATHLGLVEGSLARVEHHEGVAVAGLGFDVPANALELVLSRGGHRLHDVDRSADGGGQAGRVVLERLPLQGGNLGRLVAGVVLVGNGGDLRGRDRLVLVGTRADRLGLQGVLVHRGGNNADVDEALLEVGEGVLEGDGDRRVVLRAHGVDEGEELAVDGLLGGGALVGADDVCGGHGGSIGELRALAQAHLVLGVGDLHGVTGGQRGADGVVGHVEAVQALEDLPVCSHAESRGGDRPVVGGLVGDASRDGPLGATGRIGTAGAGRGSTPAARGQDHGGGRGQRGAGCEVFAHSHVLAPHLRELGRAVLLFRSLY